MIIFLRKVHRFAFSLVLFSLLSGISPLKYAKPKLSDYNFFEGRIAQRQPADGIVPYNISAQLFSRLIPQIFAS